MATVNSSEQSSTEEYEDESTTTLGEGWLSQGRFSTEPSPVSAESSAASQPSKICLPMQKRRRVTRACDECRRKKIKCDGKQPCTHCTVYSYECTYDQPSNRRRNPAPQYIEAIENRLHRAEALLKSVLPDVDLDDPKYDHMVPQRTHLPHSQRYSERGKANGKDGEFFNKVNLEREAEKDPFLESMVENTGSLDLDDQGHWDYHGHSSGMIFLQRMREQFGYLMGEADGQGTPFLKTRPWTKVMESPKSSGSSPLESDLPNIDDLPSRSYARELCQNAFHEACALFRIVHLPTFYTLFDRIYDVPPDQWGNEENRFLPLLYIVMAVGCLFEQSEKSKLHLEGYRNAIDHGFKFFKASRQMMDITDCRDLPSLQAVLFMVIFLQSSAKLATCYSYIGIALFSAVRMGLHRSISRDFNPIEQETRRRIFWTIRKMDIYVGAILGLPIMLSDDEIDQELPQEVEDEFITSETIFPMPPGKVSFIAASNAHTKLVILLQKVAKYIYPIKGSRPAGKANNKSHQTYAVSHAKIREIERELQEWMENLSMDLRPGGEVSPEFGRAQQLLRIAYAHIQMILYRPFLHYVSQSGRRGPVDKLSYACAAACVSVSRNIIHIAAEMKKRGLLIGAQWFTMYTTFFAILSLVFYIFGNPDSTASQDILKDAMEGKDVLSSQASQSMAADRCSATLEALFDQLPERLKRGRLNSVPSKKRQASSPVPATRILQSAPDLTARTRLPSVDNARSVRHTTLPVTTGPTAHRRRPSVPYAPTISAQIIPPNADASTSHIALDEYAPSSPDAVGMQSPDDHRGGTLGSHALVQPSQNAHGLPDFSAVMFPTGDPFAYPNQSMLSLEDHPYTKTAPLFNASSSQNVYSFPPTSSSAPYDNSAVQLFGPLPPYMLQSQQYEMAVQNIGLQMDLDGADGDAGMIAMNGGIGGWPPQQQAKTPGMNLDDVFGEGWKAGWFDHGFVQ